MFEKTKNSLKNLFRWLSFVTPDFPTKRRWLEMVFRNELKSRTVAEMTLVGTGGLKFRIAPGSVIGHEILLYGLYEKEVAKRFCQTIKSGDLVVDAGANLGQYTLLAARKVGPRGLVISVEPVPHIYQRLSEHVEMNGLTNVKLIQAALGSENGSVVMHVIADENDGMHHVAVDQTGDASRVQLWRLDDVISEFAPGREVAVLKIDVEGWEEAAFEGAPNLFRQPLLPVIFFESIESHATRFGFSARQVQMRMVAKGMRLEGLSERRWRFPSWQPVDAQEVASNNLVAVPDLNRQSHRHSI